MFVMVRYWQKSNIEGWKVLFWESQQEISNWFQKLYNQEKIGNFYVYNLLNCVEKNRGGLCLIGIFFV